MSEPPVHSPGPQPRYGRQQPYGPPQQPYAPPAGPGYPPLPTPPKRNRTALIVAGVVGAVVVLGGLAVAAVFVFGARTLSPESVQKEVVRVTQEAVHEAPTDVRCPDDVAMKAGTTFTCTATIEGQPVSYAVTETDGQGNLTIKNDSVLEVAPMTDGVAKAAAAKVGVPVSVTCATGGRKVLVEAPNTPIHCTMVNTSDPTDTAAITVTVDGSGTADWVFDS